MADQKKARRTPEEIATAKLDEAKARLERADKRVTDAKTEYDAAVEARKRAAAKLEYVRADPDLPADLRADLQDAVIEHTVDGEPTDSPV